MRPQILFLPVQPKQIFLILAVSMAVVFIYNVNTAITFVFEYFFSLYWCFNHDSFYLFVSKGIELCFIYERGKDSFILFYILYFVDRASRYNSC